MIRLAALALALTSVAGAARAEPADAVSRLSRLVAPDGPGCALAAERDGRPLLAWAGGLADLERPTPITLDTVFEAGSVSKQVTAAALAWLAAQGRLSLDDDVRRWIPELPRYAATITLRMLLTHTSGLRNWDDLVELQGWEEGRRAHTQSYVLKLIARQTRTNFAPGAEYLYSNSNYVLAVVVAERVTGEPFDRFMHTVLFRPLGLTHTRWRDDFAAVVPGRAQAYSRGGGASPWRLDMPFADVIGPGALLTTVGDLLRWTRVLQSPSPEQRPWVDLLHQRGRLRDGTRIAYALGLEFGRISGVEVVSHAGSTAGYRTWLGRAPTTGAALALLCNDGDLNTEDLGPELFAALLPVAPPVPAVAPAPAPSRPAASGVAEALVGAWRNLASDARVEVAAKDGGVSFNGGPAFRAIAETRLETAAGTRSVTVSGRGAERRLTLTRVGNAPVTLAPADLRRPDTRTLETYAGVYRSGEEGVSVRIRPKGEALEWLDASGERWAAMTPLYRDAFDVPAGHWTAAFRRDAKGRVTRVEFTSTRTRRMAFVRR